ncbi:hypothetical protein N7508_001658 [Penicillium antarcticum]|uniref:uncharacterized protein n=1 Tax=Penicillium antarcticum TaxID=416450 RepID=UPI0023A41DFF|nr:uncharacterized protein N7508_001658 [Penicillium antarcticum]KAJ5317150.1 hypothetical protein N7508_001658 [Penicillium antarcticum]
MAEESVRPKFIDSGSLGTHDYTPVSTIQDKPLRQDDTRTHYEAIDHPSGVDDPRNSKPAQDSPPKANTPAFPSARLYRSGYIIVLISTYISMALFSWVTTCYLSFRPANDRQYGFWTTRSSQRAADIISSWNQQDLYVRNERWYRAARIIQSVVSVLTIPLISAVCSSTAVMFIQRKQARDKLSIRQVITLADKGWTDLTTYARVLPFFSTNGWKRHGSSFLLFAMLLNLLGAIISPLQQLFISTTTIKTPTEGSYILNLFEFASSWTYYDADRYDEVVILARSTLTAATVAQPMAQLWASSNSSCAINNFTQSQDCITGTRLTLGEIADLNDPFIAQLTNTFHTGLVRQYIPRINSSAQYTRIDANGFPSECDKIPGSFYVNYSYSDGNNTSWSDTGIRWHQELFAWGIRACIPNDITKSPWRPTRDRQDFFEELYLNFTVANSNMTKAESTFYKVKLDTTAGYFELPNYMNNGVAGHLLDEGPNTTATCGRGTECAWQWHNPSSPISYEQQNIANKGPLRTVAMALFGNGSFPQTRLEHPHKVIASSDTWEYSGTCINQAPLGFLFKSQGTSEQHIASLPTGCIADVDGGDVGDSLMTWMLSFTPDKNPLTNEDFLAADFTIAAFLANQAWMEHSHGGLMITYDMGADTQVPTISVAGITVVSILLGLLICILLPLALYASIALRWTPQLDAFTMMRMGASVADKVPLQIGREQGKIKALDEIPGWIGDYSETSEEVGKLGLGGSRELGIERDRRFECYEGDHEKRKVGPRGWRKYYVP